MRAHRSAALLIAGLLGVALVATPASAHATYRDSDPKKDATVSEPPSQVMVEFTEPPSDGSQLFVYDPCGERVDAGDYTYDGVFNRITVSVSADKAGAYVVEWKVLSDDDGHVTGGDFSFTSSGGEACPGSGDGSGSGSGSGSSSRSGSGGSSSGGRGTATGSTSGGEGSTSAGAVASRSARSSGDARVASAGSARAERARQGRARETTRARPGSNDSSVGARLAAQSDRKGDSVWDLPLGGVLMALLVAAGIGAAGGFVYAGIMGPKR